MVEPNKYTVLFYQIRGINTRTYQDFATVTQCMKYLLDFYLDELQRANPTIRQISYNIDDVLNFIDSLAQCNIIVFDPQTNLGTPFGKNGVKTKMVQYLEYISDKQ
ncbi:hypothetical protein AV274_2506 [Blastocystis sp. ATCC 50177/Nand II]|uniref:Enhancer of rudimentary n=1 Tax=Blastocystis sp. subtype 1 (strain ATCC 50177 / NandII) TaxID=478820 RepID=A0A196SHK4_BLAHN|nr:hypothetical protein AV274_2506 [Blastocystis sp. ATCC 50177/Nand II]